MESMVILTNESGRKAVTALCDIALKVEGLKNLPAINAILSSIKPLPSKDPKPVTPIMKEKEVPNSKKKEK